MKHPDVIRLEELFGKYPGARPRLLPTDATLAPGQIWAIAGATAQYLFTEVMLLGRTLIEDGLAVVDVAPLVHDATLAGPMDYILPENVLCHHAAVLFSLSFSLPQGKLGVCMGTVDEELSRDLLVHYGKSQGNCLKLHERHAPDFFDTQDARFRFHEEAAGQIAILQKDLYQWLDRQEDGVEGNSLEIPMIQAAHLFSKFVPSCGIAAAGEGMPGKLDHFDLKIELDGHPARLTVRQSVKQGWLILLVHGDRQGRCAKLLSASGKEIASIKNGEARFKWTNEIADAIVLADEHGHPIAKIMVQ
jgi:hypothetical protein